MVLLAWNIPSLSFHMAVLSPLIPSFLESQVAFSEASSTPSVEKPLSTSLPPGGLREMDSLCLFPLNSIRTVLLFSLFIAMSSEPHTMLDNQEMLNKYLLN